MKGFTVLGSSSLIWTSKAKGCPFLFKSRELEEETNQLLLLLTWLATGRLAITFSTTKFQLNTNMKNIGSKNLTFVSFYCRAGGDWSTTYAPSPFYMTSKMRSLYLEGYDYSVFDMTRHDRVQIQVILDNFAY
jgi:hypothetical protein